MYVRGINLTIVTDYTVKPSQVPTWATTIVKNRGTSFYAERPNAFFRGIPEVRDFIYADHKPEPKVRHLLVLNIHYFALK